MMALSELKPYENNPRLNDKAVGPVAESIRRFGFRQPIVVDRHNVIVAGHTRYKAAVMLELDEVPVVHADELTATQVKAYRLADNKTAEMAVWDMPLLEGELEKIGDTLDMTEFGFDLEPADVDGDFTGDELNIDDFGDDSFEFECPHCGYRFDDYGGDGDA